MKTPSTEEDRLAIQTEETPDAPGNGDSRQTTDEAQFKTLQVKITGTRPLLLHNGQTADPLNEYAVQLKDLTKKTKKTPAIYKQIKKAEWMASIYWNDKLGLFIPDDNIMRCIQLGAQKIKLGKIAQAALFMDQDGVKIEYPFPKPKTKEAIFADERFRLEKTVRIQNNRMLRVRAMIPTGWKLNFELQYDPTLIRMEDIVQALDQAGALIGLGDWRPKFGRFIAKVIS